MLEITTIMLKIMVKIRNKNSKTDVKSINENPINYVQKKKTIIVPKMCRNNNKLLKYMLR